MVEVVYGKSGFRKNVIFIKVRSLIIFLKLKQNVKLVKENFFSFAFHLFLNLSDNFFFLLLAPSFLMYIFLI